MAPEDNSLEKAYEGSAYDSSLESPASAAGVSTAGSGFGHKRLSPFHYNKIAFLVTGVAMGVILLVGGGSLLFGKLHGDKTNQATVQKADKYSVGSLALGGVKGGSQLQVGEVSQLDVNGRLQVSKTLVIAPTTTPTAPTLGQIYFDKTTNTPFYYNGSAFVSLSPQQVTSLGGASGALNVGGGLSVVNSTINNTGVTSLQGQSGDVNFTSGNGISVNGTTISNSGVLSVSGTPNQLSVTNNNGDVQVRLLGVQDGGVVIGAAGGLATITPTATGQCLVSDGSNVPVFGSCTGTSTVQSIQVGSNTLSGALVLQATGGLGVTSSGNTITIDGSGIAPGGDVSFGATHTAGHVTALDGSGNLISTDLINQSGGLQAASSAYYLDLANAGTSTFTVKNTTAGQVANLVVTGTVKSNGLLDSAGNLYSFDATPTGTSRELCYVDNLSASNCPAGGDVSYGATHLGNTIAALDNAGNLINSDLNVVAGGLQVVSSNYSLDVKDANNSTLTVKNSTSGKAANLVVTGTISAAGLLSGSDIFTLPTNGGSGGVLCYVNGGTSNCPTGGNVSTTGSPSAGTLAVFTGSNTIGNSIISDNGSTVSIGGDLTVNAITAQSLQSAGALTITAAGSLNIGSSSQVIAVQGNASSSLIISSNGRTMTVGFTPLASTNRTITFPDESGVICLQNSNNCGFASGGSGVTSLNSLTGALTINNATTAGSTITLNNASTSVKGIASFNSADFSVSSGVVSTIQPIGLTSAVQFGSLTLGTGDLTLAAGNTVHTDNVTSVSGGLTISAGSGNITFTTDSGNNSFIFPTYGGTGQMICTIATTCAGGAGSAVILEPGTGSTSQVQTASTDRNAIFINKASGLGNLVQLQAGGSDALVIDGSGNTTISNTVHATGSVTVDGTLTASTISSTGALTIGSTSNQFVLQGNGSSTLSATASGNTTTVGFTTPTGNNSILFPNAGGTICLSLPINNCGFAAGGSGISGSGTIGKIAKFTGTSAVGDSLLSETGSIVTVSGNLAVGVSSSVDGTLVLRNATNANTITIQAAAAPGSNLTLKLPTQSGTFAVAATGPLSLDLTTGQLSCATCLTSGGGGGTAGVASVDGLTGALTINNSSGTGTAITLDNAAADGTTKGIATFNATNFTASGGVVNLVQDIATTSSPTFANLSLQGTTGLTVGSNSNLGQILFKDGTNSGFTSTFRPSTLTASQVLTIPNATGTLAVSASGNLSLSALGALSITNSPNFSTSVTTPLLQSTGALSITPGGALTVGATGQSLALQGNGSTTLSATVSGNKTTVGFTTPTAARSILFPDAGGTVCLSLPTNNCGFAAGGSGVTSLNGLTGALTVANASASSGTITLNNAAADGTTKGIATFNSSNFSDNGSGVINTIQNIGTGASPTFGGLTAGGTITFGGLSTGVLHASSLGVISSSAVQLGTDTTGSYVANLGALTGLTTTGNSGAGSTPTLSVTYGNSANTAVQGNTTVTCASGTGNLTGGGGSIVLGTGGSCGALNLIANPVITGNVVVQGGGLTLGVNGTATGAINLANATGGSQLVTLQADSRSVATTIHFRTDPNVAHTTDYVCLEILANCSPATGSFINNGTSQQTNASFNIQAGSGNVAAKIQGASGQDIIDFYVAGNSTPIAKIDSAGLLTATAGLTANGGTVNLNDNSGSNATNIGTGGTTGAISIGSTTAGAVTLASGTSGIFLNPAGGGSNPGVLIKPATNTTAALQLQNAASAVILNIDTTIDATNLITNASFEANTTGWTAVNGSGTSAISRVTSQQHVGSASLQVATSGTATNAGASYPITLADSTVYSLSFHVKGGTSISDIIAGYSSTGLVGGQTNCTLSPVSPTVVTTGWTRVVCSFTTAASHSGTPYIYISQSGVTGHTMYLDAVRLEQAAASSNYRDSNITLNGAVTSASLFQNANDSTTAFQIQNAAGTSNLFVANTLNGKIGIGMATNAADLATLQVNGDIKAFNGSLYAGSAGNFYLKSAGNFKSANILDGIGTGTTTTFIGSGNGSTQIGSLFQNASNSTTAFQIQNVAGTALLNADTTNLRISIGSRGTPTGQLYVAGQIPTAVFGQANGQAASYGLAISGRYAYVTPTGSTKGVQVFDISNPAAPTQIGNGVTTTSSSAKRIKIQGKYAYVAGGGFLQVFDISNPAVPVSLGSQTYTAGTNTPSVYVQGRYVYVGESTTPTLYVFDVANPASIPTATSLAIATTSNGAADMYAQGRYLYLANGGTNSFQVVDVANPAAPSLVTSATLTTSAITSGTPLSVVVQGRYAYLGTTTSVYVIDVSAPSTASSVAATVTLSGAAHSLFTQGRYLYAGDATTNGSGLIRTIDISTPASAALLSGTAPAQSPLSMAAQGRYLYTANNSSTNTIQVFDMGGEYAQQLEAGGIETDGLSVRGNASFASDMSVQGSLGVGSSLQVAGNSAFGGNVLIKGTNSTTVFQVQNASSQSLFTVDTTNSNLILNSEPTELRAWSTNSNDINSTAGTADSGASVVAKGYIYYIGGFRQSSGNSLTGVTYAKLNADGSTSTFTSATSLPVGLDGHGAVYANGYIYVVGGETLVSGNGAAKANVYYAKVNNDGSLGSWNNNTSLPIKTRNANVVTYNGYIYSIGGNQTDTPTNTSVGTVYYARVNADGSLGTSGSWSTTTSMTTNVACGIRDNAAGTVANGYVYIISGTASNTGQTSVCDAKLNNDGTISSWSSTTALGTGATGGVVVRRGASAFPMNGYLYVTGGYTTTPSPAAFGTTYYVKLNGNGSLGASWTLSSQNLPSSTVRAWTSLSGPSNNGYIYVIGGMDGSSSQSTVYYTSLPRVQVGAALDLIGVAGTDNNTGNSAGGSLTAGNTHIVGTLDVQGATNFAQDVAIGANLNVSGDFGLTGTLMLASGAINSGVADGGSAIAFKFNTAVTYATSGARLLSVQNNGTERFAVDYLGHIITASTAPSAPTAGAAAGTSATCTLQTGNDTSGVIRVHTGSAAITSGTWCTMTIAFSSAPRPIVSGTEVNTSSFMPYASATTTTLTFGVSNVTSAATGTDYDFNFFMPQ